MLVLKNMNVCIVHVYFNDVTKGSNDLNNMSNDLKTGQIPIHEWFMNGFVEAIESVYPETKVQLCIVHMIRNSLKFVSWKERKKVAAALKNIYNAQTAQIAKIALGEFRKKYDERFPAIGRSWQNHWDHISPFFDYPKEIRRVIYINPHKI